MKNRIFSICFLLFLFVSLDAQTLQDARKLYTEGRYAEALPIFEKEYQAKPTDASINHWYGVCLYMTDQNLDIAEKCLLLGSSRKVQESNLYLGMLYTDKYDFQNAEKYFDEYEAYLNRKGSRTKVQKEQEHIASEKLAEHVSRMQKLRRMVLHTEDIQIIDSVIVSKDDFLSAYALSFSGGRLASFNEVFNANVPVESTVYFNEKETKMYYGQPADTTNEYTIYTMEYLLDHFGNDKKVSKDNFGLTGNLNYPFVMPDGVTVYFAAEDPGGIGGYDLFITRYNINNDTYLKPERLNMPFNSMANDYMLVIDEEKGVGWFASDRGMTEGNVCIYTFIPNDIVKIIQSEDQDYLARRAKITAIKDSWKEDTDYSDFIARARKKPVRKAKIQKDFEFVVNDDVTYYTLNDFTNPKAKDQYYNVLKIKLALAEIEQRLDEARENFENASSGSSKRSIASGILDMESKRKVYLEQLADMENSVRSLELIGNNQRRKR